ncbi:MAG: hypothetical protein QOF21_2493, partial [Actinomycetota bacterium]
LTAVERFQDAVDRRDVAALRRAITADCVFECPKGNRFVGDEMVDAFARLFAAPGMSPFATEEVVVASERAVVRWLLSWDHGDGDRGELRGIDLFRVRNGAIAEMFSYAKS